MYLNCHSYFSLRYGTIPINELVEQASACNVQSMALTDINVMTGVYEFAKKCAEKNIKPLAGIEFRNGDELQFIGIAKNMQGFAELNKYLSHCKLTGTKFSWPAPPFKNVFVIYSYATQPQVLQAYEYIGINARQLNKLAAAKDIPMEKLVLQQTVSYRGDQEYELHKILRAIENNTLLTKLEENQYGKPWEQMIDIEILKAQFENYPGIINTTQQLIDECSFDFEYKSPKNKKSYTASKSDDMKLLRKLAFQGAEKRYGPKHAKACERIESELKIIDDLSFAAYFLITWDIIEYSTSRGFFHVGRGSGANSIVAYCIGITEICPLELNLYFERFLNPSRSSPPDFDIDWSWKNRDEILSYIFNKYGADYVAFTGTVVEFKYRSIIRELGKVFGLSKTELDILAANKPQLHALNSVSKLVHKYGKLLEKYPNQLSMHSCGVLISEEPISNYLAVNLPPKGFPTAQIDMHIAEDIGLEKLDILSQRGLGHINDCIQLIKENRGLAINIRDAKLTKNEARANESLQAGKTIGCFYIESPAMRGLLRRLKCDNYKVLVAASSVIRPGVAQSGMMGEYIYRHNHPNQFEYFHKVFEEQLGETYGIMVYQEDVMKIAHHFAGLDLKDTDILRRGMSGKTRSKAEMQRVEQAFFENCKALGHSDQLSQEVYRQIQSFAGYSFCKAHSASYAIESYQSLYLKAYFPIEFMVAVINNFGGFYRTEVYFHEARMEGANICQPCVNQSDYLSNLHGTDIYIGFIHIEKLPQALAQAIEKERKQNGPYQHLEDFVNRNQIGIEALQLLIFVGAFRFTNKPKSELILEARLLLAKQTSPKQNTRLFEQAQKQYQLPKLAHSVFEDAFDEIELLGFTVSCSPFELLQTSYRGDVKAKDLLQHKGKTVRMLAYLIARKHVPTKRGEMYFGTWIDHDGNYFDTTHFNKALLEYPFQGGGCYLLLGKVEVDYAFPMLIVEKMAKMPFIADPRYADDKDNKNKVYSKIREDISLTHRLPYPSPTEIGLPRYKMSN